MQLTFYLMAFYLPFLSAICSDSLSGILSAILSDILSGILSDIQFPTKLAITRKLAIVFRTDAPQRAGKLGVCGKSGTSVKIERPSRPSRGRWGKPNLYMCCAYLIVYIDMYASTSSTAQGGGGSFKIGNL